MAPRPTLGALALAVVASQFAILDGFVRGSSWLAEPRVLIDVATSIALLFAMILGATTSLRRALVATLASALLVFQLVVFRYYHVPLDLQVLASAVEARRDVRPILLRGAPMFVVAVVLVTVAEWSLLGYAHRALRAARPMRAARFEGVLAIAALGGLLGLAPRRATPEVRAVHSLRALSLHREPTVATAAVTLPPLVVERAELPSILFVLTESVRAADYRGGGPEPTAPETAAFMSGRTDLTQLRAVSSYTALSLSAVLTGRSQEGPREGILRSPSLFDFAHAARDSAGARPFIAYFSAHSSTIFETDEVRARVDHFVTIETLRGHELEDDANYGEEPLDRDMVDRFVEDLPALPASTLVMMQLANTHAPYFVDPERAPFAPYDHVVSWAGMPKLLNAYRDSIYEQDRTLTRALRAFVEHAGKHPWLIVFTSDHGEAFGEHGAIHHGQNLMDEQVHVPAWIATGNGALSLDEQRALHDNGGRFATHLDLLPTMLDALGLWDNFSVAPHRAVMPGQSLLRPHVVRPPVPVTNCTGMFHCPINTWGLYAEDRKLVSRAWDGGWGCFALGEPDERVIDGPDRACEELRVASRVTFPLLPNGAPNR